MVYLCLAAVMSWQRGAEVLLLSPREDRRDSEGLEDFSGRCFHKFCLYVRLVIFRFEMLATDSYIAVFTYWCVFVKFGVLYGL